MSSWYVFHALGFYPNTGQDLYLISSPTFEEAVIHLENGRDLSIKAKKASDKNIYVQSVKLNGSRWTHARSNIPILPMAGHWSL